MKLPGGDEVLHRATGQVFEFFQRAIAARDGSKPMCFADLDPERQAQWKAPQRAAAELIILAVLFDMAEAVSVYDGCQGGAYRAAVYRYAQNELGIDLNKFPSE